MGCSRSTGRVCRILPDRIIIGQSQPGHLILGRVNEDTSFVRFPFCEELVVVRLIPPEIIERLGMVGHV